MKTLKWIPNITVNTRALIIFPQALLKQRDKCVSLLKKAKKVLPKFGWENVIDNKKSWKTVKHLLSENSITREKINLTENENTFTSESETAEILNICFFKYSKETWNLKIRFKWFSYRKH